MSNAIKIDELFEGAFRAVKDVFNYLNPKLPRAMPGCLQLEISKQFEIKNYIMKRGTSTKY